MSKSVYDFIYLMKRQYPVGVSTYSPCAKKCGNSSRGGAVCPACLEAEIAEEYGWNAAIRLKQAVKELRDAESMLFDIEERRK